MELEYDILAHKCVLSTLEECTCILHFLSVYVVDVSRKTPTFCHKNLLFLHFANIVAFVEEKPPRQNLHCEEKGNFHTTTNSTYIALFPCMLHEKGKELTTDSCGCVKSATGMRH